MLLPREKEQCFMFLKARRQHLEVQRANINQELLIIDKVLATLNICPVCYGIGTTLGGLHNGEPCTSCKGTGNKE